MDGLGKKGTPFGFGSQEKKQHDLKSVGSNAGNLLISVPVLSRGFIVL